MNVTIFVVYIFLYRNVTVVQRILCPVWCTGLAARKTKYRKGDYLRVVFGVRLCCIVIRYVYFPALFVFVFFIS